MNSRMIIIAILILIKVIGVASRVKADNYSDCYESLNDDGQKSIARIACESKQNEELKKAWKEFAINNPNLFE